MGTFHRRVRAALTASVALTLIVTIAPTAAARIPARAPGVTPVSDACPPAAVALNYSDALDKLTRDGVTLGGLSSLAYDRRSHAWASAVDNHGTDPARIWFFRDLADPHVVRAPLVLRRADGTPYNGTDSDNEGLAVLPGGNFLVSSETEPSIRIFGRDGVQRASLPVPARFAVTPAGQATANATLEGLTITPDGRHVIAAMEGALSGDVSASGEDTLHRFLVYDRGRHGWQLDKQVAYRTQPGQRVPEVVAYGRGGLIVEEASFDPATGNTVDLYAVRNWRRAPDVSGIANLSTAAPDVVLHKLLLADLVQCPTLGAPSKETQTNPLLDNFEGMALTFGPYHGIAGVSLISDDNFSTQQTTRLLNLAVRLPR